MDEKLKSTLRSWAKTQELCRDVSDSVFSNSMVDYLNEMLQLEMSPKTIALLKRAEKNHRNEASK